MNPAGADGLFFSPHLGGRICPAAPEMRGAWIGFSWSHSPAHFFRAMAESVMQSHFSLAGFHDTVLDSGALPLTILEERVVQWISST